MNKLILSILICFILFILTKAYSVMTGNDWMTLYNTGDELSPSPMMGGFYFIGLIDMYYETTRHYKKTICFPERGGSSRQIKSIMVKWLNNNPEYLHKPMSVLFIKTMKESFPCDYSKQDE